MSTTASPLVVTNLGERRVIIGPGPASKGGGKPIRFDAKADENVPAPKRLGSRHTLEGADAERVRGSKVLEAVKDKLGLKVG